MMNIPSTYVRSFVILFLILSSFFSACQAPEVRNRRDQEREGIPEELLAQNAYRLSSLDLELLKLEDMKKQSPLLLSYKNIYTQGLPYIKKLANLLLITEERLAYEQKIQQLEQDLELWRKNIGLLPHLTPQDWKRQKHALQEQWNDIFVTYRKLYKALVLEESL
jgi:hypothetical protein